MISGIVFGQLFFIAHNSYIVIELTVHAYVMCHRYNRFIIYWNALHYVSELIT